MYRIIHTKLEGCIELVPSIYEDKRGISIKPYHKSTFEKLGVLDEFKEDLMVFSNKGVLRGLHFQVEPFEQAKLVYCISGKVKDVVLDIRKTSKTYGQYEVIELSSKKRNLIYIPKGFAHGYLTLEDNSTIMYKMSSEYNRECESGIRWDTIGLDWCEYSPIVSERDSKFITFSKFTAINNS